MSIVVEARECRICPCASFMSAPASFSQTQCEVRRDRQFTHGTPTAPGCWLDEATQNIVVADRSSHLHRLKNQVVGAVRLYDPVPSHGCASFDLNLQEFHSVDAFNHATIYSNGGIRCVAFRRAPSATAIALVDRD